MSSDYLDGTDVFDHTFSMESNGIVQIWDVWTLWGSAGNLIVEKVTVSDLLKDCDSWVLTPEGRREGGRLLRVDASDLNYPVIISPDGVLMDGNHRVAKALERGIEHLYGVRFKSMPKPDIIRVMDIP